MVFLLDLISLPFTPSCFVGDLVMCGQANVIESNHVSQIIHGYCSTSWQLSAWNKSGIIFGRGVLVHIKVAIKQKFQVNNHQVSANWRIWHLYPISIWAAFYFGALLHGAHGKWEVSEKKLGNNTKDVKIEHASHLPLVSRRMVMVKMRGDRSATLAQGRIRERKRRRGKNGGGHTYKE